MQSEFIQFLPDDHFDDKRGDPFWPLMRSFLLSRYEEGSIKRVLDVIERPTGKLPYPDDFIKDKWRPHEGTKLFMDGIQPAPFWDKDLYPFIAELEANHHTILQEYEVLLAAVPNKFRPLKDVIYDNGWNIMVLYLNGRKAENFPHHLCPVTSSILAKLPIGRMAGFSRQLPKTGIPEHSDDNNMWLSCQMGLRVPKDESAWIRVGPERRYWSKGNSLVFDTTFQHETFNPSNEERIVLHVDFYNFRAMTPTEIFAMMQVVDQRTKYEEGEIWAKERHEWRMSLW